MFGSTLACNGRDLMLRGSHQWGQRATQTEATVGELRSSNGVAQRRWPEHAPYSGAEHRF